MSRGKRKRTAAAVAPVKSPESSAPASAPGGARGGAQGGRMLGWLLLAALVLRLVLLGRADLWQDEMLLIMTADIRLGLGEVFRNYWQSQMVSLGWLPLPAMIQNVFMSAVSGSVPEVMKDPFWARLPGVVLGVIGVWGVWAMARDRYARPVALGAAWMAAATFYPIFYAREVHAYPLLLALAPWTVQVFSRVLFDPGVRAGQVAVLVVLTLLLAYSHLTAPMLVFALAVVGAVTAWSRWRRGAERAAVRQAVWATGAVGVAGALVIPVFLKILGGDSPHLKEPSGTSPWFILNDVVAKLFLGDLPVAAALAWVVVAVGAVAAWRARREQPAAAAHLALLGIGGALILAAALRTQYLSARYFAVITPMLMIVLAAGLAGIARWLAVRVLRREGLAARVGHGIFALFIGVHLLVFLPPMYALKNKSVDFGSIARWLNENLPPGAPYVMESAYELRYVSGFYPTPGLVAAAPYVHGNDASEVDRLWERQEAFFARFPEAVLVESAYHTNAEGRRWDFPGRHFRRVEELRDDALRRLVRMGIYGTYFRKDLTDTSFVIRIHHNTEDDLRDGLRAEGRAVWPRYPDWQIGELNRGMYARVMPGAVGGVRVENVTGGAVTGLLELVATVVTDPPGASAVGTVRVGAQRFGPFALKDQVFAAMPLGEVVIPAGGEDVVWRIEAESRDRVRALVVLDARFAEAGRE